MNKSQESEEDLILNRNKKYKRITAATLLLSLALSMSANAQSMNDINSALRSELTESENQELDEFLNEVKGIDKDSVVDAMKNNDVRMEVEGKNNAGQLTENLKNTVESGKKSVLDIIRDLSPGSWFNIALILILTVALKIYKFKNNTDETDV